LKGSTFKRCGCRDPQTGKQLGGRCPKLSRRTHGKWWARYQAPGPRNGKRSQPTLGPFDTERDAQAALASVLDRINRGTYVELDRQTFGDYLDQWLSGKVNLRARTRLSYETHIRLYLKPALGHVELAALRDQDFEELYGAMRLIGRLPEGQRPSPMLRRLLDARTATPQARRPLSPARIRRVHSTSMSALNSAVRRRKLAHNPAQHVELESGRAPRALVWTDERVAQWRQTGRRPSPVMVWTPAQTVAFLDLAQEDRLYPLWHLIAHRGLRRGEAVHAAWTDVDLDAARATIREQGDDDDGWSPKSAAGNRTIGLDAHTVAVLRAHRAAQNADRLAWGEAWVDSGRVFTKEDGSALNPDSVSQRFDRLVARHHLPPVRLHDLRHGAATLALAAGADLKVVSHDLGHSSTQITQDIYTSVLPEVSKAAADAVAELLTSAREASDVRRAHTLHTHQAEADSPQSPGMGKTAGQTRWGGWGSNPRPKDYESSALTD
jgi:integrase